MASNWRRKAAKLQLLLRRSGPYCHWCKRVVQVQQIAPDRATLDHVVPKSQGGGNNIGNLVVACMACNSTRGDVNALDWARGVTQAEHNRERSDRLRGDWLWQQLGGYRRDLISATHPPAPASEGEK